MTTREKLDAATLALAKALVDFEQVSRKALDVVAQARNAVDEAEAALRKEVGREMKDFLD